MTPKRLTSVALCLLLHCLCGAAATFSLSWIAHPEPDDSATVWFRHTYVMTDRPQRTCITVATTGYAELYVNGRNATADILSPWRGEPSSRPVATTYDVSRYMRADSNVVAVWYAPADVPASACQVAVCMFGTDHDGRPFAYASDADWLCRHASAAITASGGELIDATGEATWTAREFDPACWVGARVADDSALGAATERRTCYEAVRVAHIHQPRYFDIEPTGVTYDFGTAAQGLLRVTLRDAQRGERISLGASQYTCSGLLDEQFIQRFTTTTARRLCVSGDAHFAPSQIQKVEIMELQTYQRGFAE